MPRGMAPTPFLLLLGLIGMNIAGAKEEQLPPPRLTLLSSGDIYKGQSADLQCSAPGGFQETIFYLYKRDSGKLLQSQNAPEATSTVIFTLHGLTDSSSGNYVCTYQARLSEAFQTSGISNMEYLTVIDVPVFTTPAPNLVTTLQVPSWIVVMAGAVTGIVVLVLLVTASVAIVRKFKEKKKHEQREKESAWISGNMDTDWSYDNVVYDVRPSSDPETSPSHVASRDTLGKGRTGKRFGTFHA